MTNVFTWNHETNFGSSSFCITSLLSYFWNKWIFCNIFVIKRNSSTCFAGFMDLLTFLCSFYSLLHWMFSIDKKLIKQKTSYDWFTGWPVFVVHRILHSNILIVTACFSTIRWNNKEFILLVHHRCRVDVDSRMHKRFNT